jgi:undecaprenyl-diphosphatase
VGALWVLGAVAMVILSVLAHQYRTFPDDLRIAEMVQQIHQPVVARVINFASDANWPTPAGIIALVVIAALAVTRHVRAAIAAAVAGFGADLVNALVNGAVARPRPNDVHIHAVANVGLHSYPSGHVTHVVAFYGFLLYLSVGAVRADPRWSVPLRVVQAVCLYFIIFIGLSRVLEGEHWPSDVVASYLLGALMLIVGIAIYHGLGLAWSRLRQRRQAGKRHGTPP